MHKPSSHQVGDSSYSTGALSGPLTWYARSIREELRLLLDVLESAETRQWERSPVPRLHAGTGPNTSERPSDPTADAALDPRRLAVRETVMRSQDVLHSTLIAVRGARLAVERAVARFDGEADDG